MKHRKKIPVVEIVSNNVVWLVFFHVSFALCYLFIRLYHLQCYEPFDICVCFPFQKEKKTTQIAMLDTGLNYAINCICIYAYLAVSVYIQFDVCMYLCKLFRARVFVFSFHACECALL